MSREVFARDKRAGCLSNWQVSQRSLGLASALDAHLQDCPDCRARVDDECSEIGSVAAERPPAVLVARAGTPPLLDRLRPPPTRLVVAVAGACALAAGIGLVIHRWRKPAPRPPLVATVTRDGRPLVQGAPPNRIGKLRAGDKLRLRVQDTPMRWVRLLAQQGATLWDVYYEGPIPADGWLPTDFTVTPLNRMQLRVLACPEEPAAGAPAVPAGCITEQLDL